VFWFRLLPWEYAIRNLFRRPLRTTLTFLGLSIVVLLVLIVVGRIGGSANPWVEGRAAFSIVDLSLKACSDREGDECAMPWDYCCETDLLPKATVLVKVVDDSGNLVATDARELLQAKELQTVVVEGKAKRDEAGNLTVLAGGVYAKP